MLETKNQGIDNLNYLPKATQQFNSSNKNKIP